MYLLELNLEKTKESRRLYRELTDIVNLDIFVL